MEQLNLYVSSFYLFIQVEKQRVNKTIKSQQFEDAKNEYASQLQKTNEAQAKYYNHFKPQVLTNFQDLDERRIKCIQVTPKSGGKGVPTTQTPNVNKCAFNKHTIKVCVSYSLRCPGTSTPSVPHLTVSLYFVSSASNVRVEVEGPSRALCQLKKPFKALRPRLWSHWKERKTTVFPR